MLTEPIQVTRSVNVPAQKLSQSSISIWCNHMQPTDLTISKQIFSFICTSHHLKQGSTIHVNNASAVDSNAMEALLYPWQNKHCHCPNSWKRQNWAGKEQEQAARAGEYSKAEVRLYTAGLPTLEKLWKVSVKAVILLPARPLILVSVVQVLSFFYVIVKTITENSSYNFREVRLQFQSSY